MSDCVFVVVFFFGVGCERAALDRSPPRRLSSLPSSVSVCRTVTVRGLHFPCKGRLRRTLGSVGEADGNAHQEGCVQRTGENLLLPDQSVGQQYFFCA